MKIWSRQYTIYYYKFLIFYIRQVKAVDTGLYIHIPFCRAKCNYCDFYSLGGSDSVPQDYIDRVADNIRKYPGLKFDTVYFGGGTPSLLTAKQVGQILSAAKINPGREITLEANPDSTTSEKLAGWRGAGVNRISFGVQTVCEKSLKTLGRLHDKEKAAEAFKMAKEAGFTNINGDIMLALADYSEKEMADTAQFLKEAGATHISAYMLKIESGTPFAKNTPAGLPGEEESADFYLSACRLLESLGYKQYEISNFAMPGYESRHNNIYWLLGDYLGVGPAAHSCINGQRFYFERDLDGFMKGAAPKEGGRVDADDFIMLSLRLKSGLSLKKLKEDWGLCLGKQALDMIKNYEKAGFLTLGGDIISLTPKGFLVENSIASYIMGRVKSK